MCKLKQRDLFKLILLVIITLTLISLRYDYKGYLILKEQKQYFQEISNIQREHISSITFRNDLNDIYDLKTNSKSYTLILKIINNLDSYGIFENNTEIIYVDSKDYDNKKSYNITIKTNLQKPLNNIKMIFDNISPDKLCYFDQTNTFDVLNINDEGSELIISLLKQLEKMSMEETSAVEMDLRRTSIE